MFIKASPAILLQAANASIQKKNTITFVSLNLDVSMVNNIGPATGVNINLYAVILKLHHCWNDQ